MNKNKIIHICVALNQGGIEAILYRLLENTTTEFEHVIICFSDEGFYGPKIQSLGIKIHYLRAPKRRIGLNFLVKLYKFIKIESPDIVQTWWYPADVIGGLVSKYAGVKNIYWGIFSANFQYKYIGFGTIIFLPFSILFSYLIPKKIISCTKKGIGLHQKFGYNKTIMHFIPPGIDVDSFYLKHPKKKFLLDSHILPHNSLILSCVARWDPLKDHRTLLKAFSHYIFNHDRNIFLILCGSNIDTSNKQLLNILNELKIPLKNILLLNKFENIVELFHESDINLLTSVGEGFPNVIIESMSCGTACIATNVGDISIAINNYGWLIESGDYINLSNLLYKINLEIKQNENFLINLGIDGRNYIKKYFSIKQMTMSYANIWNS
jgi:glycosyltransferase involved in cell wall biosynthesis